MSEIPVVLMLCGHTWRYLIVPGILESIEEYKVSLLPHYPCSPVTKDLKERREVNEAQKREELQKHGMAWFEERYRAANFKINGRRGWLSWISCTNDGIDWSTWF
jgi:hypothetical protein